jgi:hypothetical protein
MKKQIINFKKLNEIIIDKANYIQLEEGCPIFTLAGIDFFANNIAFKFYRPKLLTLDLFQPNISKDYQYNFESCVFESHEWDSSKIWQGFRLFGKQPIEISWPFENIRHLASMINNSRNKIILEFDSNGKLDGFLNVANLIATPEGNYKVSIRQRNKYYDLNNKSQFKFLTLSYLFDKQYNVKNNTIIMNNGGSLRFFELAPVSFEEAIVER